MPVELTTLPNATTWSFERIAVEEPERAAALEAAGSPSELLESLRIACRDDLQSGEIRFACEESGCRETDVRIVVQLHIASELFDWLFNARTGYRAHFRMSPGSGLRFNTEIVELVRRELQMTLVDFWEGRRFDHGFADRGVAPISKAFALTSLTSDISKIWLCTALIDADGSLRAMPTGVTGPRLLVEGHQWLAWFRDFNDSWIELKGAFLGPHGPYQLKDTWTRALRLHENGTA
jgi:hypothetical protein